MFANKTHNSTYRRRYYANVTMGAFVIANVTTTQRRIFFAGIPMNVFDNKNALMVQRRRYCTIIPMNAFAIANVTTTQLGTSCSFDSPGLARNEPPLGNHPQGDSMLYALRLLGEHIVFVSSCVSILGPTP